MKSVSYKKINLCFVYFENFLIVIKTMTYAQELLAELKHTTTTTRRRYVNVLIF